MQAAAVLISKFFAEKLELGKMSLADNMQEMLVKVLNVDPTTTILTDESKGYLSRLFSGFMCYGMFYVLWQVYAAS